MNSREADWPRLQNILILLLVFAFCLYLPSLFHETFADDNTYLAYTNRFLRESNWSGLYQLFLRPTNPWEFLPLRDFTYWLDFRLYGDDPNGFHATNLAWYAVSGLVSAILFREFILLCRPEWGTRVTVLALCGALAFLVHPAHVEVAAWIASRKDLVAGTLGMLSLAMLARGMRLCWRPREMVLAVLLLGAACFGKAAAMTNIFLVMVLIGLGWSGSPEVGRAKKIAYLLLFWAVVALAFLIHLKVGEDSGIRIENHPGLFVMLERASRIFVSLIGILFFPYPLRFYYDVYQIGGWHWLVTAGAVFLILVSLRALSQRRSLWALGVLLSVCPLVIYLQLIPFTTWSLASERFVFVPVAGLALVLIDLFGRIGNPLKIGGLILLIVLPSAAVVWSRIANWGDSSTLLIREYEMQPNFHNAIRDHIVAPLLPAQRYAEAKDLARKVGQAYGREVLLALIDSEAAFQRLQDIRISGRDSGEMEYGSFCKAVATLQVALDQGFASIPNERDVSYNNLFRTIKRQLDFRYADAKVLCKLIE